MGSSFPRRLLGTLGAIVLVPAASLAFGVARAAAASYTITANGSQICALGTFIANVPGFSADCDNGSVYITAPPSGSAYNDRQLWEIDSPSSALTITGANLASVETNNVNNPTPGYGGGTYWNGGGQALNTGQDAYQVGSSGFSSQYFGLQLVCGDSSGCDGQGSQSNAQIVSSGTISLTVQENQPPEIIAAGGDNLYYQSNNWVWNAPGDPWPATLYGADPSGICSLTVDVNDSTASQLASPPNGAVFQQCPSPLTDGATVDTTSYVPSSGQILVGLSAQNAAGIQAQASATVNVDNVQPTVAIEPLNDANPGGWSVNHSVTLRVAPAAGPSGISSFACSDTVAGTTTPLTLSADTAVPGAYDVTVDGNGSHAVACSVVNNAVNPQGAHNTGSTAETVDIDEQPPTLSIEPTDPSNPDQVVVQTSDNESQVSGGSIQVTAQGSGSATTLPTTLNSDGQLMATIPDATLAAGEYTLQASATSQVGNTGTTSESLTLPLRTASSSIASFAKIDDPLIAKQVKERVRVGGHLVTRRNKHGKLVKVRVGGHFKTITVIKRDEHCVTKRVKVAKHKWKLKTVCKRPHVQYQGRLTVGHGKTARVYGELTTNQGVPIANQSVVILTAPDNGHGTFTQVASTTTDSNGGWKTKLPAGPSRIVQAMYPGSGTLLPASSIAHLYVPARIKIAATPTRLPWSATTTIHGRLEGGYIPPDGVALRLLIRLPGRKELYSPAAFRTTKTGRFSIAWSWGRGSGVESYPFAVATTADESDYPYTAATSKAVNIEFGVRTPVPRRKKRHAS